MKHILIFTLLALSGFYTGLFLYHYRQKDATQDKINEHLTQEFWENVTLGELKEKLQSMKNVNEVRPSDKKSMLHLLAIYGKYPEMVNLLITEGVDYKLKDMEDEAKALHYTVIRQKNSLEFTKELLKFDTNVNEPAKEATALMWARTLERLLE